ncbi:AraC family transcriptional regulator [Cohnella yongneupensis]|uniref:Helix-turn-helix domain-containing protein n=1 Tax=Cohnella yongneupensis TaxID=425006 RepID=A0ABW0QZK2_9BACL
MYYDDIRLEKPFEFVRLPLRTEAHDVHYHECLEVCIVLDHEVEYRFGDTVYHGEAGDIFVCRPFEPHWGIAKEADADWILLLFSPSAVQSIPGGSTLLSPFYTQWLSVPKIPRHAPQAALIRKAAEEAVLLHKQGGAISEALRFKHLIDVLLLIYDYADKEGNRNLDRFEMDGVLKAIQHILTHSKEDVDGDSLIKASGLRKSVFYRAFRELTGVSPLLFLQRLRIQFAMDLLVRSAHRTVLQIAEDCGFQSLRTFNNQFKSYTGVSPRIYREKRARQPPHVYYIT